MFQKIAPQFNKMILKKIINIKMLFGQKELFFRTFAFFFFLFIALSPVGIAFPDNDFSGNSIAVSPPSEETPSNDEATTDETTTGCFTYIDSSYFCQEITRSQAEEECSVFDRCQPDKVFVPWQSCSEMQACKNIICKASCLEEYAGRCPSGEVPREDWCVPGCCQFDYGNAESQHAFCQFVASRQLCEVEVANKETTEYRFNPALSKNICVQQCAGQRTISVTNETISESLLSQNESQLQEGA